MAIELRSGLQRPNSREDYSTKALACKAQAIPTPLWNAFFEKVLPDEELRAYLKRVCGYCLTGIVTEHVLFFLYGTGRNGKGVFLNTIRGIWADYATTAPAETFMESKNERHPTELARLLGVHLVIAQELERNQRWAESKIKGLTGGDKITARFMRQDFFEFSPQFKIMIAGNHKPSLHSVDEAIKARIHLIPFSVFIPTKDRDKDLAEKLRPEWPGILHWAVQGCIEWQKHGLNPPTSVLHATAEYLKDQDTLGQWIDECCQLGGDQLLAELFASWKDWTMANGLPTGSSKNLALALIDRGFERQHTKRGRKICGLSLLTQE
jgi:P4 family phage/plasmid primase-like protien